MMTYMAKKILEELVRIRVALEEANGDVEVGIGLAAEELGVSEKTVRRRIEAGTIPATKNDSGHWVIKKSDIK